MGWFWATEDLEDVSPDGGGICGGEIVSADLETDCLTDASFEVSVIFEVDLLSTTTKSVSLDIDGYGIRDLESTSRPECGLDLGNGLQVYGDDRLLTTDANILRFGGTILGAGNTIGTYQDVTVVSPPSAGSIDGGPSANGDEVLDGGNAYNGNQSLDGGNAEEDVAIGGGGVVEPSYSQEVDIVSDYLIYKGWALPSSITSDPVWRVQEIVIDINGDVSKRFADGNDELDNVWDNRASLTYL